MNLLKFKSKDKVSPFGVEYDYAIGMTVLDLDLDSIKKFLLEKEIALKEQFPNDNNFVGDHTDGDTGLGGNSVTARFPHYTLWDFDEMEPVLKQVEIYHDEFLEDIGVERNEKIFSQAWYNVMRNGDKIKAHRHSGDEHTYLSAHLTVSAKDTCTTYYNPMTGDSWKEENIPGKFTIFPSYIVHETDTVTDDQERITIAMDFLTKQGFIHNVAMWQEHRWIELEKGVRNV